MKTLVKSLPDSWEMVPLRNLLSKLESGSRPKGGVKNIKEGIPSIGGEHLDSNGAFRFEKIKFVPEEFAKRMTRGHIKKNDILIVKDGATTSKTSLVRDSFPFEEAVVNEHVFICRCSNDIDPNYLFHFLFSAEGKEQILRDFRGAAQGGISQKFVDKVFIPVAPPNQQKKIVAEIEKQFSRLDEAVTSLKRAKANLKRYKAAVLKAAVEGKLTEEWRKQHPDVEPAAELLKRILAERRRKWEEAELVKMRAKGNEPKDEKWKNKYKTHEKPETENLPQLAEEWAWVTWEMVLSPEKGAFKRGPFGSALKKSYFVNSGYQVYEQYCPINDDCSFARYFISEEKYVEMEAFSVRAEDFLISCSGSLGRITQVPRNFAQGVINQALLRVRMNNVLIDDSYFLMLFRSPFFQNQFFDNSTGSAMQNVKGVKQLKMIPMPLPSLSEQHALVQIVEALMSVALEVEIQLEMNLRRVKRIKQAILNKAFIGALMLKDI